MRLARKVEKGMLQGVEWMRACSRSPRGIVLVPPLIGGHALQQLRLLRPLVRHQFDLISFNYAGHGNSQGAFSLRASTDNSLRILDLALRISFKEKLPLYGLAACYAARPLVLAACQRGEPMAKMVLINAVPHWRLARILADFLRYWQQSDHWQPSLNGIQQALRAYQHDLLPGVIHRNQAFGILSRQRIQWLRLIREVLVQEVPLDLPLLRTPVLCIYGLRDRLLQQLGFSDWPVYQGYIRSICPQAQFCSLNSDHFLAGPGIRRQLVQVVVRFLGGV